MALTRLHRKAAELQNLGDEKVVSGPPFLPAPHPPRAPEISLQARSQILASDAIREYIAETLAHKSTKTFAAYCTMLYFFSPDSASQALAELDASDRGLSNRRAAFKKLIERANNAGRRFDNKPLAQITRKDLLDYSEFLKTQFKSSPRMVHNRIDYLQIFLHHFGLPSQRKPPMNSTASARMLGRVGSKQPIELRSCWRSS